VRLSVSRPGARTGWLATGALVFAMLAHGHGSITQFALDQVAVASLGVICFRFARQKGIEAVTASSAAIGLVSALAALRLGFADLRYMPYLLIVPVNLAVAWLFAGSLRPGREPILLRLIGLMGIASADDPHFRRFIARQCLLWAGLSLATAGVALAAMVFVAAHPWLADVLVGLFAAQVAWFMLSHHYASLRYGRPEGWWTTARAMMRPEIWSRLRA
jgi:hypothetical protein